jgi:hypothetical protein
MSVDVLVYSFTKVETFSQVSKDNKRPNIKSTVFICCLLLFIESFSFIAPLFLPSLLSSFFKKREIFSYILSSNYI